jgi:hypothetical protein
MQAHPTEISANVAPGARAVLDLDRTGWHMSGKFAVPGAIALVPLPPLAFAWAGSTRPS